MRHRVRLDAHVEIEVSQGKWVGQKILDEAFDAAKEFNVIHGNSLCYLMEDKACCNVRVAPWQGLPTPAHEPIVSNLHNKA